MSLSGASIEDETIYPGNFSIESVEKGISTPEINILRRWSNEEDKFWNVCCRS